MNKIGFYDINKNNEKQTEKYVEEHNAEEKNAEEKYVEEKICKSTERKEKFLRSINKIGMGICILGEVIVAANIFKKCMNIHDAKILSRYRNTDDIKLYNTLANENKHTCAVRFDRRIQNNILSHDETVNMFKKGLDQIEKDGYTLEQAKLIFSRDKFSDTSFMNK